MPKIGNGRVSTDGTGSVSFIYDNQTIPAAGSGASTALSVTGNSEGGGTPIFLNQNSNVGNVILNFATLSAGTNISFDTTTVAGEIIINATGGGGGGVTEFVQLTDGPEAYSNHSLLYSTVNSVAWTAAPSGAGQFLYYNGSTFAFTANVVTSVAATGTAGQITVTGSPITSSGTLTIGLATAGTAGTYSTVTVDAYGRVISGTTGGGSSTVTLGGDVSGTGQTGTTITTTLAVVQAGASYASSTGIGVINTVDTKGRSTSTRALTLADLTNIGGAPINSPAFTGTPTAPTPAGNDNTTKLATTAWVVGQGYIKSPLVATGDASGTSSGSSIVLTLANVVTAGTYSTVTVDSKGRVIAGTQSSGGVTSVALASPNSTINTAGSPITSAGTFNIDLPTVIVPGTFTSVTVDAYGRVIAGGAGGSGGTVTDVGMTSATLVVSGGPITVAGTFDVELAVVATAGTYSTVTIDHFGRVISGTSGGGGGGISNIGLTSGASTLVITGSPLTANGTFNADLATVGAAGTYSKVTVDTYGRVTGHSALTYADLPAEVQVSLLPFSFPGAPAASIDIIVPVVQATTIPNGMTNTAGYALTPATATATFSLSVYQKRNADNHRHNIFCCKRKHSDRQLCFGWRFELDCGRRFGYDHTGISR